MALSGNQVSGLSLYGGVGARYGDFSAKSETGAEFIGHIPNIAALFDSGTPAFDLSVHFTGAATYSIDPAIETGWTFDTDTGELVIDTDDLGSFGPYIVTGENVGGNDDSNGFFVTVYVPGTGGSKGLAYGRLKRTSRKFQKN